MNEFEWRVQMRNLRQPLAPQRDLWTGIDAALDQAGRNETTSAAVGASRRRRWLTAAGVAASLLLVASLGWRAAHTPSTGRPAQVASSASHWKPSDPRLSAAAIELDAARMELLLALQQAPDSAALQRLLGRTQLQQNQLRQLARQPG